MIKRLKEKYSFPITINIFIKLLSLISSVILMRMIVPSTYGIIAMIIPVVAFQNLFHAFGGINAIVSRETISDSELSSLFWGRLISALLVNFVFILSSPLIIEFYNEPQLNWLIWIFACISITTSCSEVFIGILYKKEAFKVLSIIELSSFILSTGIAIVIAFQGYGLLALAVKELVMIILMLTGGFFLSNFIPKINFKFKEISPFLKYGLHIIITTLTGFFARNLDDLLIGKKFGSTDLGYYSKAYSFLTLPHSFITNVAFKFALPLISKQTQEEKAIDFYLKIVKSIFTINAPICLCIYFSSEFFIPNLFGENWIFMIPFIKLFSILSIFQVLGPLDNLLYEGRRNTFLLARNNALSNIVLVIFIILGYLYSETTYYLATTYVIGSIFTYFPNQILLARAININPTILFKNIIKPFLSATFTFFLLFTLSFYINTSGLAGASLMIISACLIFFLSLYFLFTSEFKMIKSFILNVFLN